MSPRHTALLTGITLIAASHGFAQPKPAETDDDRVARVHQVIESTQVELKSLVGKKMTFAEFVTALEGKLRADRKIALKLDAEGLGKELPRVAGATITLQKDWSGQKVAALELLRSAISRVREQLGIELDYAARPDGVVVSFPRFAIFRISYDLPALVGRADATPVELQSLLKFTYPRILVDDDVNPLAHLLTNTIPLRAGERVELQNGTRLIVAAAGDRHEQFRDLIDQCGRLLDLAVVMNARLFEVDRTFFDTNVAPLFPSKDSPPVVRLDRATFEKFRDLKPLVISDGVRLRRGPESLFLSRQFPFRSPAGNGVEGVALTVNPALSADRRFIRLTISQKSTQLVGVKKSATGESPDLRSTGTTGVVQVPDEAPILMRVDYRPSAEAGKDKVWLMVARPLVWIDGEMRERYLGELEFGARLLTPAEVDRRLKERGVSIASVAEKTWGSELPTDLSGVSREPMRLTQKVTEILQAAVNDVLKNPKLKQVREFYGTVGDDSLVVESGPDALWPAAFVPQTAGYKLVNSKPDPFSSRPRVLGLRLGDYTAPESEDDYLSPEATVEIELFNSGGSVNGAVAGKSSVRYSVKRDGKRWVVRLHWVGEP
jgi:hypothetical protein